MASFPFFFRVTYKRHSVRAGTVKGLVSVQGCDWLLFTQGLEVSGLPLQWEVSSSLLQDSCHKALCCGRLLSSVQHLVLSQMVLADRRNGLVIQAWPVTTQRGLWSVISGPRAETITVHCGV